MKYLLILLLFISCSTWTSSKHKCDVKFGTEKDDCLESYNNFVRNMDYRYFRGDKVRNF